MQEKERLLVEFYTTKFLNARLESFSSPMLISSKSVNTDVMTIGQETNSWYGSYTDFCTRGIEAQMNLYDGFVTNDFLKKIKSLPLIHKGNL